MEFDKMNRKILIPIIIILMVENILTYKAFYTTWSEKEKGYVITYFYESCPDLQKVVDGVVKNFKHALQLYSSDQVYSKIWYSGQYAGAVFVQEYKNIPKDNLVSILTFSSIYDIIVLTFIVLALKGEKNEN